MTRQQLISLGEVLVAQYDYVWIRLEEDSDALILRSPHGLQIEFALEPLTGRWHDLGIKCLTLRDLDSHQYLYRWSGLKAQETVLPASIVSVITRLAEGA